MKPVNCLIALVAMTIAPLFSQAQVMQRFVRGPVVQQQPVYTMPTRVIVQPQPLPAVVTQDPFAVCKCGTPGHPGGDCQCKDLDCKIRLGSHCKTTRVHPKQKINIQIIGKIPKYEYNSDCRKKICDFQYQTEVPQVHCKKETCIEIGKMPIPCLPTCWFEVCVPTYRCLEESVECKLAMKKMNMQLWERMENGVKLYDVHVINDPNQNSAFHAGGMPTEWVIMHCGTLQELKMRFPGATGSPLFTSKDKNAKPQSTKADVNIALILDKKKIEAYAKQLGLTEEAKQEAAQSAKPQKAAVKTAAKTVAQKAKS